MRTAKEIAESIVAREGGYVNDPDDLGGATKFGVTIHTMRRLGIDLTGDGQVTSADVAQLSRRQAVEIFLEHYFKRPGIDNLPAQIQASVFDMHVNTGANAVKILQRLLVEMGHSVQVDGIIGAETSRAANTAQQAAQNFLNDAYGIARRNYYYSLADERPKSRKYARRRDGGKGGWIVRAEAFISKKYHLSAQQHQERTAAWD